MPAQAEDPQFGNLNSDNSIQSDSTNRPSEAELLDSYARKVDTAFNLRVLDMNHEPIPEAEFLLEERTKLLITGTLALGLLLNNLSEKPLDTKSILSSTPEERVLPELDAVGNILDSITPFYSEDDNITPEILTNAKITIGKSIASIDKPINFDIPLSGAAMAPVRIQSMSHAIRTPLTIAVGFEALINQVKGGGKTEENEKLITSGVGNITHGLKEAADLFTETIAGLQGEYIHEPRNFAQLLDIVQEELLDKDDAITTSIDFQSLTTELSHESVNISEINFRIFLRNWLNNAVNLAGEQKKLQTTVIVSISENEEGYTCANFIFEDRLGGFKPPISQDDGSMVPGDDGFFFQQRSTKPLYTEAEQEQTIQQKARKGGLGWGMYTDERLLYYESGVRMIPENIFDPETGKQIGARFTLEKPLAKISFPSRIAMNTSCNMLYEDAVNLFGEIKNTQPNLTRLPLRSSPFMDEDLSTLKSNSPQAILIELNPHSLDTIKRLHALIPEAAFIAFPGDLSLTDQVELENYVKANNYKIHFLNNSSSSLKQLGDAISDVTQEINKKRI